MTTDIVTLSTDQFAKWDDFVDRSPHGTIFHKSWWLEASQRPFKIYCAMDKSGELEAGIPIFHVRKYGLGRSHTPPFTPFMGPIFDIARHSKKRPALTMMRRLGEELARAIPVFDSFSQRLAYGGPDLQGFLWAGYQISLSYTYRYRLGIDVTLPETASDVDGVRSCIAPLLSKGHKHALTKAKRSETIQRSLDLDRLLTLVKMTFARQGNSYVVTHEALLRRLFAAAAARQAARVYLAMNQDGRDSAGVATFSDRRCAYLVLAGGDPELRSSGGGSLCILHAMSDAFLSGLDFDFEGSQIRSIEEHYRGWGPPALPFYTIAKQTARGRVANAIFAKARGRGPGQ